ncbi:MAG: ribonuclease HI family protein [Patescibacteria group bacterium]
MSKLIIYTDGGSRGNPGPAGAGAIIYDEHHQVITEISEFLGTTTNNQAEYRAILAAIKKAVALKATEVEFYLDSELAVKQLNREYKVKNKDLAPLFLAIYNLTLSFKKISFTHIPRERNSEADRLANEAMDRGY